MSSKRTLCSLYLMTLVVSVFVEGSPVVTTTKSSDITGLKAKGVPILTKTEAQNPKEDALTPKSSFETNVVNVPTTHNIDVSTTLQPGKQTTTTGKFGHDEPNEVTTKNPTSIDKPRFKPSPHDFGDSKLASGTNHTTQQPTTHSNLQSTVNKHVTTTHAPSKSQKKPSLIHKTRIYQVKSQKGCSSKKEHDVKVHIGEGRYLNIKITED